MEPHQLIFSNLLNLTPMVIQGEPYEFGDVNGSSKTPSAFELIDGGPTSGMQSGSSVCVLFLVVNAC